MNRDNDIFSNDLYLGDLTNISSERLTLDVAKKELLETFHLYGKKLQPGLVGGYLVIKSSKECFIARTTRIYSPQEELKSLNFKDKIIKSKIKIDCELLYNYDLFDSKLAMSIFSHPIIGSSVYICQSDLIIRLLNEQTKDSDSITLGTFADNCESNIDVDVNSYFERHVAVIGTTGGGKSHTLARIVEELSKKRAKCVIFDPTGEFECLTKDDNRTTQMDFKSGYFSYRNLIVDDLLVLFTPSGQSQIPKFYAAIDSLTLLEVVKSKDEADRSEEEKNFLKQYNNEEGKKNLVVKAEKPKIYYSSCSDKLKLSNFCNFNIRWLHNQLLEECINPSANKNYGTSALRDQEYCSSLLSRIRSVTSDQNFANIFNFNGDKIENEFSKVFDNFLNDKSKSILRLDFSSVPTDRSCKELLVNSIGRYLLNRARNGDFREKSFVLFLDEAHQFLSKSIGNEIGNRIELTSFDSIAKECRKHGLYLVISTQLPRDIPIGTLSQIGNFIIHRLINEADKNIVMNAASQASQNILDYLPALGKGEAILVGTSFQIPILIKMALSTAKPNLTSPGLIKKQSSLPTSEAIIS